jgi:hypothetical protein
VRWNFSTRHEPQETIMYTLRTARLTLAALSVSFGATLAPAADKKPSRPAAPPVVKKPSGWSLGASNPTGVNKPHAGTAGTPKMPNGFSWGEWIPPTAAKPHAPAVDAAKKPNGFSWGTTQTGVKQRDATADYRPGRPNNRSSPEKRHRPISVTPALTRSVT